MNLFEFKYGKVIKEEDVMKYINRGLLTYNLIYNRLYEHFLFMSNNYRVSDDEKAEIKSAAKVIYDYITNLNDVKWIINDGVLVKAIIPPHISDVTIPDNVTSIGKEAFYCTSLKHVSVPDSVESIGHCAFAYCNNLTKFNFPKSLKSIESEAFSHCSSLHDFSGEDMNIEIEFGAIMFPDGLTHIGEDAFEYCKHITELYIPDTVYDIANGAFSYCSFLREVNLSNKLEFINPSVFYGCTSLKSVNLPDSVGVIAYGAFAGCSSLDTITFSKNINLIEEDAFRDCTSLKSVIFPDGVDLINEEERNREEAIPENIISIGFNAFKGTPWNDYYIIISPEQLKMIEESYTNFEYGQTDDGKIIAKINRTDKDKVQNLLNTAVKHKQL